MTWGKGQEGDQSVVPSRGRMVGKDVASTFLCCFVGILLPERRINRFVIQFSEILRHFNHKNYNREDKTCTTLYKIYTFVRSR